MCKYRSCHKFKRIRGSLLCILIIACEIGYCQNEKSSEASLAEQQAKEIRQRFWSNHDQMSSYVIEEGEDATSTYFYKYYCNNEGVNLIRVLWNGGAGNFPETYDLYFDNEKLVLFDKQVDADGAWKWQGVEKFEKDTALVREESYLLKNNLIIGYPLNDEDSIADNTDKNEVEKRILDLATELINEFKNEYPAKNTAQQSYNDHEMNAKIIQSTWKESSEEGIYYYSFLEKNNEIKGIAQLIQNNTIVTERLSVVELLNKKEKSTLLTNNTFLDVLKIDGEVFYLGKDTEGPQENTYYLVTDPKVSPNYRLLSPLDEWFVHVKKGSILKRYNQQEFVNKLEYEAQKYLNTLDALGNFDFIEMFDKAQKHQTETPTKEKIIDAYYKIHQTGEVGEFADFLTADFSYQRHYGSFSTKKYKWSQLKEDIETFRSFNPSAQLLQTEQIGQQDRQYIYEAQYEIKKEELHSTLKTIEAFVFNEDGRLSALEIYQDDFDLNKIITPEYLPPDEAELLVVYEYYKALNDFDFTSLATFLDDRLQHLALVDGFSTETNKEQLLKTLGLRGKGSYSGYEILGKFRDEVYVNVTTRTNSAGLVFEIDTQDRFQIKQGKIIKMTTKLLNN